MVFKKFISIISITILMVLLLFLIAEAKESESKLIAELGDGIKYPGITWKEIAFNVPIQGYETLESIRNKKLKSSAVMKYYKDYLKKLGWTEGSPSGSSFSWGIDYTKNNDICHVRFDTGEPGETSVPADPNGAQITIYFYKKN